MKINESTVAMSAARQASKSYASQVSVGERVRVPNRKPEKEAQSATLELSDASKEAAKESREEIMSRLKEQNNKREGSLWQLERKLAELSRRKAQAAPGDTEEDFKIKMLRRLLESLRAMQEGRKPDYSEIDKKEHHDGDALQGASQGASQSTSFGFSQSISLSGSFGISQSFDFSLTNGSMGAAQGGSAAMVGGSHWEERVTMSSIYSEKEVTAFSTVGTVKTADGREINFNLNLEMSREFTQAVGMEYSRKIFCVDPLVINLDGNPASFGDQAFLFDLDQDGKEEELSQLGAGSGFLALDKNGDGTINDGSELFGTKSGDGFKDLAAYDEDGNGWIDENDSVFKHLKVWTRDEDGKDRLVAIGAAGVGAIYLGRADTEFSLNKLENNETQGIVRSTGIFLKESGEVGTIQHVDMVV